MGIIGVGMEVVNVTGEGSLWVPQDDKFDGLLDVWNARAADRRKHPADGCSDRPTVAELVRPFARVVKSLGIRPNPDDAASMTRLSAVLALLADAVWSELSYAVSDAIPATPGELAGPSLGDGAKLWRKTPKGDGVCGRVEPERRACWDTSDQWEHAFRQAAWRLLGIPADSWEAKPEAPTKLKDLLDAAATAPPASPPKPRRKPLLDRIKPRG